MWRYVGEIYSTASTTRRENVSQRRSMETRTGVAEVEKGNYQGMTKPDEEKRQTLCATTSKTCGL